MELVTLQEAENYFSKRYSSADYKILNEDEKESILTTAEDFINTYYQFLETVDLSIIESIDLKIKKAVFEQALYMLKNPELEKRASYIQQGVSHKEVYQSDYEKYKDNSNANLLCPLTVNLLKSFVKGRTRIV
jgi:hypothetical protein